MSECRTSLSMGAVSIKLSVPAVNPAVRARRAFNKNEAET
jgi:hypothetical protein